VIRAKRAGARPPREQPAGTLIAERPGEPRWGSPRLSSGGAGLAQANGAGAAGAVEWSGRTLIATSPSGRVAWLRLDPAVAQFDEVHGLRQTVVRGQERRAAALRSGRETLRALSKRVKADAERLSGAQLRGDRRLARQLVDRHGRLDRRLSRQIEEHRANIETVQAREWAIARSLRRRGLIDDLLVTSAAPLFAAFGRRTNPFAPNNLALTLLLLVWLIGDDIVDAVSGWRRRSGMFIRDTDLWSYVAPIANFLIGWLLLRRQQHERFTAGFADSFGPPTTVLGVSALRSREQIFIYRQDIDLTQFLAPEHIQDFVTFANVPAFATVTSVEWSPGLGQRARPRILGVSATVDRGTLTIEVSVAIDCSTDESTDWGEVSSAVESLRVAWIVDNKET
jgi:hypothetical protein